MSTRKAHGWGAARSLLALAIACGSTSPRTSAPSEGAVTSEAAAFDDARGGRIFDAWRAELGVPPEVFTPDYRATVDVLDGVGGPRGDGTLLLADGTPLVNDGHDYRLKNLFGWDLRGADGIYGPAQMNKPFVRGSLLAWSGDVAEVAARLAEGSDDSPAFAPVMDARALGDLAAFIVAVRDGQLPRPEQIFALAPPDAGHYALNEGGDVARGHALYGERCASCHGADGTQIPFDDGEYSLGSHARQKAYEDWLKIINGHPGSAMGRMVRGTSGPERAQEVLDLLAALCDRGRYPRGEASKPDVADGDPRCGAYLR